MTIGQIEEMVRSALLAHRGTLEGVEAFLFGSYARGEAKPDSDLDILVVEEVAPRDVVHETWAIREHLTDQKCIDLLVVGKRSFEGGKTVRGSVFNDVVKEGVRLV